MTSRVEARIDAKGRLSLVADARKQLGIATGDVLAVEQDPETRQVRLVRIENVFDELAKYAVADYDAGRTLSFDELKAELDSDQHGE